MVVILRKNHSWKSGNRKYFERALSNSKELLNGLREAFPSTNVTAIYMEDLPICGQIRYAHNADVLMGVHGAGLVHLWWIQEEALMFEFVPKYKISNPTFKVLSALVGRNYYSVTISGKQEVAVNVSDVAKTLISITSAVARLGHTGARAPATSACAPAIARVASSPGFPLSTIL